MTAISADERDELAQAVRAACERLASEERVREVCYEPGHPEGGYDAKLWAVLCQQVGITSIALPEEYGGAGMDASTLGVVAHELGRVLAPVPLVTSAVLATGLLIEAGAPVEMVEQLTDGERTAATVLTGDGGVWARDSVALTARASGDEWRVQGSARHVLHGAAADLFVVVADAGDGLAILAVPAGADGLRVTAEHVLDGTRPMAMLEFDGAAATMLSHGVDTAAIVERCADRAVAMLAAEQVGTLERVLEIASDYARTREQFGRSIGSFQAIKHRCADILVSLEMSRSAAHAALEAPDDEFGWRAAMAKAVCSEALREASHANIQIHGGIGFTWEGSAGLYMKRARTDEVIFGLPGQHWDRLGAIAGLP